MIIESVVAGGYIIYYGFCWEMVGINYMLIPMTFVGFMAYITAEKKDRYVFWGWFVPGVFYTLLAHFATNAGLWPGDDRGVACGVVEDLFGAEVCAQSALLAPVVDGDLVHGLKTLPSLCCQDLSMDLY